MKNVIHCMVIFILLGWSNVTQAQNTVTRSFSINLYGVELRNGSSFGTGRSGGASLGAVKMPDPTGGNRGVMDFNFTLPEDHAPGTNVFIRVLWRTDTTACALNFIANTTSLIRPGELNHVGNLVRVGNMQAHGTPNIVQETRYRVNFHPTSIEAGNAVVTGLYRSENGDTCAGNLYIQGLSVVYEGRTEGIFRDGFEAP